MRCIKNWCKLRFESLFFSSDYENQNRKKNREGFSYLSDRLNSCHCYRYSIILNWNNFSLSNLRITNFFHKNQKIIVIKIERYIPYKLNISSFYMIIWLRCILFNMKKMRFKEKTLAPQHISICYGTWSFVNEIWTDTDI